MTFHTVFNPKTNELSCSVNFPVENKLFHEWSEEHWSAWSDREAYADSVTGQTLTYKQLLAKVKSLSGKLQSLGIKEDDVVIFSARATFKTCLLMLALFFAKTQVIVCKYALTLFEVQSYFKDISAKYVFSDQESMEKWIAFSKTHHSAKKVYHMEDEVIWSDGKHEFKTPSGGDAMKTCIMMTFTSGSTGPSKAVMLTHYNMVGNAWSLALRKSPEDCVFLLSNPLSHLTGVYVLLQPLFRGGKLVVAPEDMRENIVEYSRVISKYKCTHLLAMPVTFKILAENAPQIKSNMATVKFIWTGGSFQPDALFQKFHQGFPQVTLQDIYGLSETNGIFALTPDGIKDRGIQLIPNTRVRVEDVKTRKVLGPGEPGEIMLKGPGVFMGYLNRPDATAETLTKDGWMYSGDIGYFRKDNYGLVIVDRLKQMIKCLDSQVAPAELEQVLLENQNVLNALVVGVPHEKYGEAPTAFIVPKNSNVPKNDLEKLAKELIDNVNSKAAYFKRLYGGVHFVTELPKTDSGKFSRVDIRRSFINKELRTLILSYVEDEIAK